MSPGDVAIIEAIYATGCWCSDGDPRAAFPLLDEQVMFVNPEYAVVPGTRTGHAGFAKAMLSALDDLEWFDISPVEFIDQGGAVIVHVRLRARGRRSGVEIDRPEWHVWHVRDGRATRVEWMNTLDEARRLAEARPYT